MAGPPLAAASRYPSYDVARSSSEGHGTWRLGWPDCQAVAAFAAPGAFSCGCVLLATRGRDYLAQPAEQSLQPTRPAANRHSAGRCPCPTPIVCLGTLAPGDVSSPQFADRGPAIWISEQLPDPLPAYGFHDGVAAFAPAGPVHAQAPSDG